MVIEHIHRIIMSIYKKYKIIYIFVMLIKLLKNVRIDVFLHIYKQNIFNSLFYNE